jgi:phage baseplate assembly protein W
MATIQKIYSDIDFTFTRKPVTNDVALSFDQQAVIRSIRNILLTKQYEKKFNPTFGSNVDALLFENVSPLTASALESEITTAIQNYEPRATIQSVVVSALPDENAYSVSLTFFIENATQPTTITLLLQRDR